MKKIVAFCFIVVSVFAGSQMGQACSTFCFESNSRQPVFGKNYDWRVDEGLIIVNKRNVSKTAAIESNPVSWTSKYGSVTFNQYGREYAHGGMNEAGLVIELMWLNGTQYPASDSRPGLGSLQWIQYQLDNFSTVAEVIASDAHIRIASNSTPLHYLVCDSTGTCASIEFLEGKLVYHSGETMPFNVLTNSTYAQSAAFLKQHEGFGGTIPPGNTSSSYDRFVRAANLVKQYDPAASGAAIEYAFGILTSLAQGEYTKWSIVYDIAQRRVYFRTFANPQLRYFDLNMFDFSCDTPVKVLAVNADGTGDVAGNFVEYTRQLNRDLIGKAYKKTEFTANIPDEILDIIADYPDNTICQNQ